MAVHPERRDLDVHDAYKCRVRTPWWRVPYVRPADLFVTYMNADTPGIPGLLTDDGQQVQPIDPTGMPTGVAELPRAG